jgi:CPA2 family monovalent cation:H+ antiporter-2
VVELIRERVAQLRAIGLTAVAGDAAEPATLVQAHITGAQWLVVATPDTFSVRQMVANARLLNPQIRIVVRSHNEEEAALLSEEGVGRVFLGEAELADGMAAYVQGARAAEPGTCRPLVHPL